MDFKTIKKLIRMVEESSINEIEVTEGDLSIRVRQGTTQQETIHIDTSSQPVTPSQPQNNEKPTQVFGHTVKSPMVGTVYLAPEPGAKTFVKVGQSVKVGDTLCLIEAMKMFNKIKSDANGRVTRVLIDDAQAAEFNQPLFEIEE